ncbi:hypothetical protein [Photobacterium leiognathi]|uniref:hypothetical protein n=1 Tax=Photobacterium leiognathi TaxID=553611 RepID=UPI002739D002|nr:hypothetical protein [Photobacterium leiognathi]
MMQNFIKYALFEHDLSHRVNLPLDVNDANAILISTAINNLLPELSMTCSDRWSISAHFLAVYFMRGCS